MRAANANEFDVGDFVVDVVIGVFDVAFFDRDVVSRNRLAFCACIRLLERAPQLRRPMAVMIASFSSESSGCLSSKRFRIAMAAW